MLMYHMSFLVGLTYFLTTVKHEAASEKTCDSQSLLEVYLQRFPDCEHILTPLDWSKEKKSIDLVSCLLLTSFIPVSLLV